VWGDSERTLRALTDVAQRAVAQRRGFAIQHEVAGERRHVVAFPVQALGAVVAVAALDLAARPEQDLQAVVRHLEWGSAWLEVVALRRAATGGRLKTVLDVVASAQGHERFAEASGTFVTELATRLGCDRVSLGVIRRGRAHVRAVSNTADLGNRTNLVRAIAAAMDEALDQKASVVVPQPEGAAARVRRAHEQLAREGAGTAVCTVPFARGDRLVGAITLERRADRPFDQSTIDVVEAMAALAGPALELLRREDRWLPAKMADAATRTLGHLVGPRHVPLKLGVVAAFGALLFLAIAHGEYRVTARAVMEAGVRRGAVAPFAGFVREAPVRAGDLVRDGQVIAVLDDRELRLERAKLESEHDQLTRQRALALAQGNPAQINIARAQIEQTSARLALVDEQLGKTRVVAGFDGVVVAGDLSQALGAPIDKGQLLFEIAPLNAYRLVVYVDERDIRDVVVGRRGQLLLAAAPVEPLTFTVATIVPVSVAREGRNVFRVEAAVDQPTERLRPGMEGVAKIDVDRRLLVAMWTRSVVDWARLALWTWTR
jgi:multidrug resistance efflux pump